MDLSAAAVPTAVIVGFATMWWLGFKAGTRSSRSTLEASRTVMSAATATSAMANHVAQVGEDSKAIARISRRFLKEAVKARKANETLLEMVKAELMAEVRTMRERRNRAVSTSERSPLPRIGADQELWTRPSPDLEPASTSLAPDRPAQV